MDSWTHLHTIHTAPESVKRVKSSAQILDKSFFWRLNATNALGGSSGHQRTPLLNACQKWSPLMTGATSKCICGVQSPEKWLNHYFCVLLFTCPEQWVFGSAQPNINMYAKQHIYRVTTSTIPSAFQIELTGSGKGGGKENSPALDNSKHSPTCGVQNSLQEKCFMYLAIISSLDDKPSS